MLRLALICLVISAVAAVFGFGGVATELDDIARIVFFIARCCSYFFWLRV